MDSRFPDSLNECEDSDGFLVGDVAGVSLMRSKASNFLTMFSFGWKSCCEWSSILIVLPHDHMFLTNSNSVFDQCLLFVCRNGHLQLSIR